MMYDDAKIGDRLFHPRYGHGRLVEKADGYGRGRVTDKLHVQLEGDFVKADLGLHAGEVLVSDPFAWIKAEVESLQVGQLIDKLKPAREDGIVFVRTQAGERVAIKAVEIIPFIREDENEKIKVEDEDIIIHI